MAHRLILRPQDATSEGARRLRFIALKLSWGAIAKRARCDETSVRRWARGITPTPKMRERMRETLNIPTEAWAEPASNDPYVHSDPQTTRRSVEPDAS